ncbi:hypothetical protein [Chitinophaga sp.]|uniref:hypothetical protein n=1 Tax=Chitinophaga sp. TaxID=1869181 RepID=UPI0031DB4EBF
MEDHALYLDRCLELAQEAAQLFNILTTDVIKAWDAVPAVEVAPVRGLTNM